MIINQLGLNDLNTMVEIELENFSSPWDFKTLYYEVIINENSTFFGMFIDDELFGYIGYWFINDNIDIINIAVRDKFKRQGIATKLFDSLLISTRHLNPKTITLEVNVNNTKAINLYKKLGFTSLRRIKNYYHQTNEDAYMMQKEVYYE